MRLGNRITSITMALTPWFVSLPAAAQTASAALGVNATVVANCGFTTTPLNFGGAIPTPINADLDVTSTLAIRCSFGTFYQIAMNAGTGAGASVAARRLTGPLGTINYQLYTNAARTTVWGDGSLGTTVRSAFSFGAVRTFTIFGRIPTGQAPAPGLYTDTVTVSVTF